jgi:C-terminal processing protease CtpA/Prc
MMTVTKGDEAEKIGLQLVQYENELYVSRIDKGPFYASAIDYGDKILSINGKKPATDIKSVEEAEQVMCTKPKITLFVMRPDPKRDKGYRWVMENT